MDKHFEAGEIWLSPRGYFYNVVDVQNNHAILKMGTHGLGRKIKRRKNATKKLAVTCGDIEMSLLDLVSAFVVGVVVGAMLMVLIVILAMRT